LDLISYLLDAFIFSAIYGMLAISLCLEYGFTGLTNFGKVAFFAIGAYTSALLTTKYLIHSLIGLIIASLTSAMASIIISFSALKLREDYLAIVTISFSEILRLILLNEEEITGGAFGVRGIPSIIHLNLPIQLRLLIYSLITCIVLTFSLSILIKITSSPFGRVLMAIRDNEIAINSLGKNTALFKAKALAIGSAISGLAGGIYAHYLQYVNPSMFMSTLTFNIWVMIVLGGVTNLIGAIIGSILMTIFERSTRILENISELPIEPHNLRMIIIGLLLIIFTVIRNTETNKNNLIVKGEMLKLYEKSMLKIKRTKEFLNYNEKTYI